MPNGTYGGVRGKETKVCQKNFRFPTCSIVFYHGLFGGFNTDFHGVFGGLTRITRSYWGV